MGLVVVEAGYAGLWVMQCWVGASVLLRSVFCFWGGEDVGT